MRKARIIYNPSSGREVLSRHLPNILQRLEQAGYETSAHATTGKGDAVQAAKEAVTRRFDLLVAAGGDGTVHEVVNGLAEQPKRPLLGIIPAGTTNDFARALGIPKDIDQAVQIMTNGQVTSIDIGKVGSKYFMNIAGGGTLTELTYEVSSRWKTMLGPAAYYMKGMEKLAMLKPTHMRITSAEQTIDEQVMMFLVANSNSVGGFERLAPDADVRDGYFDVLVVKKMNIAEFLRLATQALRGGHIRDHRVIYFHTTELTIQAEDELLVNLDGELGGSLPGHFKVLHKHLSVCIPK